MAAALRPTDPALAALPLRRLLPRTCPTGTRPRRRSATCSPGMLALADEPIAGGRHKVFGHPDLAVIPQTSTIASHLPRAVGVAFAIGRAKRLGVPTAWPADALAICSFGDASANHSTSQGAINAARYTAHQGLPLPLLFVCEDNGWGISVPTPSRWIETAFGDIGEPPLRMGRRQQSRRYLRRRPRSRGVGSHQPTACLPAPAHGAVHGSCRHRRRIGLSLGGVDPRRRAARSDPGHRAPASSTQDCGSPPSCASRCSRPAPPSASRPDRWSVGPRSRAPTR